MQSSIAVRRSPEAGCLDVGKRIEHEVGQRRPAPQRERWREEAVRAARIAVERGLTLGELVSKQAMSSSARSRRSR